MRVAYFSPFPPLSSGIADYSAELVAELGKHVDLELVIADGYHPAPELRAGNQVTNLSDYLRRSKGKRGDIALYQVGNEPRFHGYMYREMLRRPGVAVLHEVMLQNLIRGVTLDAKDTPSYIQAMRYGYGEGGALLARKEAYEGVTFDLWRYPLFERVVDVNRLVVVHNRFSRWRIHAARPGARVRLVPHHLSLPARPSADAAAARERYGVPPDALLIASFGFATQQKRLDRTLAAVRRLRHAVPNSIYLIGGEVAPDLGLARMVEDVGSDGVIVTGRLPGGDMIDLMRACDIALNLRFPTGGETSGTLIRLLGLGKPVVVNDVGAFSDIPDDCCVKVEIDGFENEVLYAILERLASDADLRRQIGDNARRWVTETHSMERSVTGYLVALEEALTLPDPAPPVPPMGPYDPSDWATRLSAAVGSELADLGIGEEDPVLASLASDIGDLIAS